MTAKQCGDSETNIKVEKQPNGRVRVVIEDLSIAGNMMDVEEGVLQYLNRNCSPRWVYSWALGQRSGSKRQTIQR